MNRLTAIGLASLVAYGVLLAAKWDGAPAAAVRGFRRRRSQPTGLRRARRRRRPGPGRQCAVVPRRQPFQSPVAAHAVHRPSAVASQFRSTRDLKAFADALLARKDSLDREERLLPRQGARGLRFRHLDQRRPGRRQRKAPAPVPRRAFPPRIPRPPGASRPTTPWTTRSAAWASRARASRRSRSTTCTAQASEGGDARAQARMLVAELNRNLSAPKSARRIRARRSPTKTSGASSASSRRATPRRW